MNILSRKRAKGGRSAEVGINLSLLSPYRGTAKERKRSPHKRDTEIHARGARRRCSGGGPGGHLPRLPPRGGR
jgi:hypothetical protein